MEIYDFIARLGNNTSSFIILHVMRCAERSVDGNHASCMMPCVLQAPKGDRNVLGGEWDSKIILSTFGV